MVLTQKQESGINLEKPVSWFLEQKMKFGDRVDHNRFDDSYPLDNHNVVDIVVKGKALVECTNPKETTWMSDEIMSKKLDYFHRIDPYHFLVWFLIISFANFSDAIKQLIKRLGIILVETGIHADKSNFGETIKRLFHTRLYSTLTKIVKSNLVRPSKFLVQTIQQLLFPSPIPVTSIPVSVTTSTSVSKTETNLHQHTTSIAEEYRLYYEDMKENDIWSVNHPYHQRIMDRLT
jgi:hypothetical protein